MNSGHRTRYLALIMLLASTLFLAGCTDAIQFGTPEYQVDAQEEEGLNGSETGGVEEDGGVNETESVDNATDLNEGYVSVTYDDTYERVEVTLSRMPSDADHVEVGFGGTATASATLNEQGDQVVLTPDSLVTRGEAEDMTRELYSPEGQGGFAGATYGEEVQVTARSISTGSNSVIYDETKVLGTDDVRADVEYFFDSANDEVVIVWSSNVNADHLDASIEFDGDTVAKARLHEVGDEVRMAANMPFLHTHGRAENLLATELEDQVDEHRAEFESLHQEAREEFRMAVRSNYEWPTPGMSDSAREKRQAQVHDLQNAADDVHSEFDEIASLGDSVEALDRTDSGTYGDLTSALDDYESKVSDLANDWDNTDDFTDVGSDEVSDLRSDVENDLEDTMNQFKRPGEDEIMEVEVTAHVAPRTTSSGVQVRGGAQSEVLSYQGALRSDGYTEPGDGPIEIRSEDLVDEAGGDAGNVSGYADLETDAVADRVHELVNQRAGEESLQRTFERSSQLDRAASENSERLASNIDLQAHMNDVERGDLPDAASERNRIARMSRYAATSCAGAENGYPFTVGDEVALTEDVTGEVEYRASSATTFRLMDDTRMRVPNYVLYDMTESWRSGGENVAAVTPSQADGYGGSSVDAVAEAAVAEFDESDWMDGSFDTHGVGVATTDEGVVYVTRTMC